MIDDQLLATLKAELAGAKKHYKETKQTFSRTAHPDGIVAGIPEPDGSHMIRGSLMEESIAHREYFAAMTRLNEYILNGTVPKHLQSKLPSKAAG